MNHFVNKHKSNMYLNILTNFIATAETLDHCRKSLCPAIIFYLFQPPSLFFLLLDPLLSFCQQLPFVFLILTLLLLQLLPPEGL